MRIRKYTKQQNTQRQKLRTSIALVLGGISFLVVMGIVIIINVSHISNSNGSSDNADFPGTGPILIQYSWNEGSAVTADRGPNALSISSHAHVMEGGAEYTPGLSAGPSGKDINMILTVDEKLNTEGIDISVDLRKLENFGSIFSRGDWFDFYLVRGNLAIKYAIREHGGDVIRIKEITEYTMPDDLFFRNVRFVYQPTTGKAEILVNNLPVWSKAGLPNLPLYWGTENTVTIAKGLNGNGIDKVILDNFIVRSTIRTNSLPYGLLTFNATPNTKSIALEWTSSDASQFVYILERSVDGINFELLGNINPTSVTDLTTRYAFTDNTPTDGANYYRIRPTGNSALIDKAPLIVSKLSSGDITDNMISLN